MTKAEIIQKGISLKVDYSITHSCYDPDDSGLACGSCDSCLLRKKGFDDSGVPDPTIYFLEKRQYLKCLNCLKYSKCFNSGFKNDEGEQRI